MSTLRTSISIASSTLFPTPVNFTKTVDSAVDGYHNGFQQITIADGGSSVLYSTGNAAGDLGIVYLYAESLASNVTNINIKIDHDGNVAFFARLIPGSILFLPVSAIDNDGTVITAVNDEGDPAVISFFIGEAE